MTMTSKSVTCVAQDDHAFTWMERLKTAVDAGYYRTESCVGEQTPISSLFSSPRDWHYRTHEYGDPRRPSVGASLQCPPSYATWRLRREQEEFLLNVKEPWWKRWLSFLGW
jgi:hypothetical protein